MGKALSRDTGSKKKPTGTYKISRFKNRGAEPSDIANAAYYFALGESSFVTGTVLPVDGGNSIGF